MTSGAQPDDLAIESQKHWRAVRSMLKEQRHELAAATAELYPGMAGVTFRRLTHKDLAPRPDG